MKLTENQIQELYLFTRKHYVEWYDLQTELVDHLANDIETLWEQNPEVSFDKALNMTFKKFGVFGFADVIIKRQKALEKKYFGMLWVFLKEYFQFPKIISTLFLSYTFYLFFGLFNTIHQLEIALPLFLLLTFSTFYLTFINKRKLNKAYGIGRKKFLLQEITHNTVVFSQIPNLVVQLFILTGFRFSPDIQTGFLSILFTIYLIIGHLAFWVLPKKINLHLSETYADFVKLS